MFKGQVIRIHGKQVPLIRTVRNVRNFLDGGSAVKGDVKIGNKVYTVYRSNTHRQEWNLYNLAT
ncbi:hypothetical protein [Vibrio phage RYC]|nr:hypothetical protein [Vibrio phage RYC]